MTNSYFDLIFNKINSSLQHAVLYYSRKKKSFALIALAPIVVDGKAAVILQDASLLLKEMSRPDSLRFLDKYGKKNLKNKNYFNLFLV